jgi:hypothetical protein
MNHGDDIMNQPSVYYGLLWLIMVYYGLLCFIIDHNLFIMLVNQ